MKLDQTCVYPIRQHPAFVTSAQTQFLLLISNHPPFDHTKPSVFFSVNTAIEGRFETLPSDVILSLRHARLAKLLIFAVFFVNIVTLRTQSNHLADFTFMFEQPRHAPAPLVSYKPLLLLPRILPVTLGERCPQADQQTWPCSCCPYPSEYTQSRGNQEIPIQDVIAELEHSQLSQLIHSDSDLERPTDRKMRLFAFQLIRFPELVQFTEVRASQRPPPFHPKCTSSLFAAPAPQLAPQNHYFPAV